MKTKTFLIIIALIIILGGLLIWTGKKHEAPLTYWADTDVACLSNGHELLALHIHPELSITVDGEKEDIPANIGINQNCMAELHTHDATGMIHIETVTLERFKDLSLPDFFTVWDKPIEREGYNLALKLNGQAVSDISEIPLRDHDNIELIYTSR